MQKTRLSESKGRAGASVAAPRRGSSMVAYEGAVPHVRLGPYEPRDDGFAVVPAASPAGDRERARPGRSKRAAAAVRLLQADCNAR